MVLPEAESAPRRTAGGPVPCRRPTWSSNGTSWRSPPSARRGVNPFWRSRAWRSPRRPSTTRSTPSTGRTSRTTPTVAASAAPRPRRRPPRRPTTPWSPCSPPGGHLRRGPRRRPGGHPRRPGPNQGVAVGQRGRPADPRPGGARRLRRDRAVHAGDRPGRLAADPARLRGRRWPRSGPHVTPFAMSTGSQFRPAAPPALDSAEYAAAFNEVKDLGRDDSTDPDRGPDADRPLLDRRAGTAFAFGHWNMIAQERGRGRGAQPGRGRPPVRPVEHRHGRRRHLLPGTPSTRTTSGGR